MGQHPMTEKVMARLAAGLHTLPDDLGSGGEVDLQPINDAALHVRVELDRLAVQLEAAQQTVRDLDALVSRFCSAAGEPIPVDAIERIKTWRDAALRGGGE